MNSEHDTSAEITEEPEVAVPENSEVKEPLSDLERERILDRVRLVTYPKVIFLYPTFIVSVIAAIWMTVSGDAYAVSEDPQSLVPRDGAITVSILFLGMFLINMIVMAFDFPRANSLILILIIVLAVIGLAILASANPDILPFLTRWLEDLEPIANATFYWVFSSILLLIWIAIRSSRFLDYWEVHPNEILHVQGFPRNVKRFSAPHVRIDKEINDVFEFMLLRSGRLIIHPSNEARVFILDNVLFVGKKEEQITRMLGALQVQVKADIEV